MRRRLIIVALCSALPSAAGAGAASAAAAASGTKWHHKSTPLEVIIKKRDGLELSDEEIIDFVNGFTAGDIPDYQCAAFMMAVNCRGMTERESAALTATMTDSGTICDLSDITLPTVDKHSTGGVGDKTSMILAPIVAALGCVVPMMSGRGLGHTGGTLDKLESIPGFRVDLSTDEFKGVLKSVGAAIVSTTADMAPADRKMYALRDVTGTVPSIPLITGSIMCKKLAENPDSLVLDVKTGTGAFMSEQAQAIELAKNMIAAGEREGKSTTAFITGMDQPLGAAAGNWLEVVECLRVLRGRGPSDLTDLSIELAAQMLVQAHERSPPDARQGFETREQAAASAREVIHNGRAFAVFRAMVEAQGGDVAVIDDIAASPLSPESYKAPAGGGRLAIMQGVFGSAADPASPLADVEAHAADGHGSHGCYWGPPCHGLEGGSLSDFFDYDAPAGEDDPAAGGRATDIKSMLSRSKVGPHGPPVASVEALDALTVGQANVLIGAGRQQVGEELSFGSGVLLHKKMGETVREGELLFTLFAEVDGAPPEGSKRRAIMQADVDAACARIMQAFKFGPAAAARSPPPLIQCYIDRNLEVHKM